MNQLSVILHNGSINNVLKLKQVDNSMLKWECFWRLYVIMHYGDGGSWDWPDSVTDWKGIEQIFINTFYGVPCSKIQKEMIIFEEIVDY